MSRLADLLEERHEELVRRWKEQTPPGSELEGHLREVLMALGHLLREGLPAASPAPLARWRPGFDVERLVREYGELRELIEDLVREAGLSVSREEERRLERGFRQGVAEVVTAFAADRRASAARTPRLAPRTGDAEERVRRAVEAARLGTWDFCPRSRSLVWDDRCKRLFGLPPEAPVDYDTFLAGIHPDDREAASRAVQFALAGHNGGVYGIEFRTIGLGDGRERWVDARGRVFFDPSGWAVRFTGTVQDITERKRQELERLALLERERAARAEAERANHLKDDFLATVSHELRTPLTAILGWVQLLRSGHLEAERRERALETVERNARAQAQLVEDLLDVGRILSGRLTLEVETVELGTVVESALESVGPAATAKGVRLQSVLDPTASVLGDSTRLQQIVWNLLSNAVKFTPPRGRVQVVVARRDASVVLTVADTGQGIDAAFQPHVFERFRQPEGGPSRGKGGLGLGLSIVKHLVGLHGGSVEVFSEGVGRGAAFTVRLPLAVVRGERALEPGAVSAPYGDPELAGVRLLLVEDEADTREFLRDILERFHAQVETAASAEEGLRALMRSRPDIVVSDLRMPGEDGYAFIRKVRALSAAQGGRTPVVALSAFARTEDRTRALLAGFKAHVPKPVACSELVAVLLSLAPPVDERV